MKKYSCAVVIVFLPLPCGLAPLPQKSNIIVDDLGMLPATYLLFHKSAGLSEVSCHIYKQCGGGVLNLLGCLLGFQMTRYV